ncbi:MAG: plastocyanin [Paracoccaceae bacterium]|jgi:plastocyanin
MFKTLIGSAAVLLALSQATRAEGPKHHVVEIVSDYDNLRMAFRPKRIVVQPGDTVTWANLVAEEHNVVSYPDGYPQGAKPLLSPYLKKKGEKWSHTFSVKGTYEYHCIPHLPMGMHGKVVVTRPSESAEFHEPNAAQMKEYAARLREYFDEEDFKYRARGQRQENGASSHKAH